MSLKPAPIRIFAGKPPTWDLGGIVAGLRAARERWRTEHNRSRDVGVRELPSREAVAEIIKALRGVLFPMRLGPLDLRQESEDYRPCA